MHQLQTDDVGLTALILVSVAWIVFGLVFLLRRKATEVQEAKRASVFFLVGNQIRILAEEKLLRETFGDSSTSTLGVCRRSYRGSSEVRDFI